MQSSLRLVPKKPSLPQMAKHKAQALPIQVPKEKLYPNEVEPQRSLKVECEHLLLAYRAQKVDCQHELIRLGYEPSKVYAMTLNELKRELDKWRD